MLEDEIYRDYVKALKNKDREKTQFLSFIRAKLKNAAIAQKKDNLSDEEALSVLKKEQKLIEETKETGVSLGKSSLVDQAEKELALLGQYLPALLSDDELRALIDAVMTQTAAVSMKDMGTVMKAVMAKAGVRADARRASEMVKAKLSVC